MPATTTGNTAWYTWCSGTTCTTSTATTVWMDWCSNSTATTNAVLTATDTAWTVWSNNTATDTRVVRSYQPPPLTPEQIAARDAERVAYEVRLAESNRLRKLAEERAELLLVQNLSLEQRLQLKRDQSFVVKGRRGYRYRIRRGRSGNVDMVKPDGTVEHRLCAHPLENVPDPDTMLAQKLMLEIDEDGFLAKANRHPAFDRSARVLPAVVH